MYSCSLGNPSPEMRSVELIEAGLLGSSVLVSSVVPCTHGRTPYLHLYIDLKQILYV